MGYLQIHPFVRSVFFQVLPIRCSIRLYLGKLEFVLSEVEQVLRQV